MANIGAVISSIRNIMRQDRGISGDAQRLEQLGWMLFLKIMDDKDKELEVVKDNYVYPKDRVRPVIKWMKENGFIPDGWGQIIELHKSKSKNNND